VARAILRALTAKLRSDVAEVADMPPIHASEDHVADAPQLTDTPQLADETDTSPNLADFVQPSEEETEAPEEDLWPDTPAPAEEAKPAAASGPGAMGS